MFPQIQETILQLNAVLFFRWAHEMYRIEKYRVVPASGRDRGLDLICSFWCSNVSDFHSCYVGNRSRRIEEEDRISLHDFAKKNARKKNSTWQRDKVSNALLIEPQIETNFVSNFVSHCLVYRGEVNTVQYYVPPPKKKCASHRFPISYVSAS